MIKKTLFILILSIITFASYAGILVSPSVEELSKAPKMPERFEGDPQKCKKQDENKLHARFDGKDPVYGTLSKALIDQADLNLDGICEVYVGVQWACGNGGCLFKIYQDQNGKLIEMGEWGGWEPNYLKPHNGWLQFLLITGSGLSYYETLYQNVNGKYQAIRSDYYEASDKSQNAKYIKTKYLLKK